VTTAILDYSQADTDKLNKENLLENEQFLDDAKKFLIERDGFSASEVQNKEDVYDAFMEHFRYQNVNELTAAKDLLYAQSETDDEGRARMGRLMNTFDRMDSDLGWDAAGDYLGGVFTAPSTYAGIFSFGAGKAGALAANQGIKFGIRQALKSGGLKAGLGSVAVDATASAGTIAAQEQTRVETIEGKDEIDWMNVGTGAAISTVASGSIGAYTGARKDLLSFKGEKIVVDTLKQHKKKILDANDEFTKKVFLGQVKGLTDSELKAVKESAKEFKNKLSLEETIPEELAKGKKLKKQKVKEIKDEFGKVKSKGLGLTLDQKHIENISAAGARLYHLIPPRIRDDGTEVIKGSKEDLTERFTSRVTRGLMSGQIVPEKLNIILKEHNVTLEELGYLYAEEISRAAKVLRSQGKLKAESKKLFKEMNEIDAKLIEYGDLTSSAKNALNKETGMDKLGLAWNTIKHLDKARIGLMTIQLATTARNTTNGFMRNYVYALDNLGAGLFNITKGGISKVRNASNKELVEEANRSVRMGVAQLKTSAQSVLLDDMRLGTTSEVTEGLTRLFTNEAFGNSKLAQELFREMGDIGNITGTEGGLVALARYLNGLNTKSDNMFKRAIFSRELDKLVFSETGETLEKILKEGRFGSINNKMLSKAMNQALEFTYQAGKFKGRGGAANTIFDSFIKVFQTPGLSLAVPFPRYMVNQFRFIYEHTPILGMVNTLGILNKTDTSERVGKQLGGLVTLYAMMQMRAELGDENTGAFEYNSPQIGPLKSNGYYDARANLGPFSAFAVGADYLYRLLPNLDETDYKLKIGDAEINTFIKQNPRIAKDVGYSSKDLIYAFTGGQGRGGTGLQFIDSMLDAGLNGAQSGEEQWTESWVRSAADAINTATVGAGVIKDLVATVDPDFRKVPDNTDVSLLGYFMKQATRSFPQTTDPNVDGLLGIYKGVGPQRRGISESPTRRGGRLMTNPLLKVFTGLSEQQEKNTAEKEFKRLNLEFFEYSPRKIKLDPSLGNEAKGVMAGFVEDQITNFITSDYYNSLPSDFDKRQALKIEVSEFRQEARDRVMNPERARSQSEITRIHRAMFYDLPKDTQKFLNYRYQEDLKRNYPNWSKQLYEEGGTVFSGNVAKDEAYVWSFSFLEKIKDSDTKKFEFLTRPTVTGVMKQSDKRIN
tara:strand:- start:3196 stop:6708 length:3513 start_codon:yes stop_codon:yes gene_type:complete